MALFLKIITMKRTVFLPFFAVLVMLLLPVSAKAQSQSDLTPVDHLCMIVKSFSGQLEEVKTEKEIEGLTELADGMLEEFDGCDYKLNDADRSKLCKATIGMLRSMIEAYNRIGGAELDDPQMKAKVDADIEEMSQLLSSLSGYYTTLGDFMSAFDGMLGK